MHSPSSDLLHAINRGSDWLVNLQQRDGSVGVSRGASSPGMGHTLLPVALERFERAPAARRKAAAWLLDQKGDQAEGDKVLIQMIVGDDQSILGWPWIDGTHSWIEPTAMSIMALDREGLGDHPRVDEGIRMILNRALTQGGWNYGNKSVFGKPLRPHPGPTGMALVALAARTVTEPGVPAPSIRPSAISGRYCRNTGPDLTGLGRAWLAGLGRQSRRWDAWLARSFAIHGRRRDMTAGLSLLTLAGGDLTSSFGNRSHEATHVSHGGRRRGGRRTGV